MHWTEALDDILLRARANGHPRDVIAARIAVVSRQSCDVAQVQNRIAYLIKTGRLPKSRAAPWSAEMDERLGALVKSGVSFAYSARVISEESGRTISRSAAIGRAKRLGLCSARTTRERNKVNAPNRRERESARSSGVIAAARISAKAAGKLPDKPLPAARADELKPLVASVIELEPNHCKWPIGANRPFGFCGRERSTGAPYCPFHAALAYQPVLAARSEPLVLRNLRRRA